MVLAACAPPQASAPAAATPEQREYLESAVARRLTEETGDPVHADLVARLLLAAATTVVVTSLRRLVAGEPATTVAADQEQVIDEAFDLPAGAIRTFGSST